ncbi:c-type cytochrome [Psychrobacillus soli]|uniref:Cytochrome c n=1 Tax=Psychrobacillus soli TaxID=1543965 RepID=A0A544T0M5_9BACI|nr:cytochrome c [Psychrobacillus soli]TQR11007.1 cytochrome c [Psychrobacillus soli]
MRGERISVWAKFFIGSIIALVTILMLYLVADKEKEEVSEFATITVKEEPVDESKGEVKTNESATDEATEGETVSSVDAGLALYTNSCIACHGNQGANGQNGSNLQDSKFAESRENVIDRITNGGATMPPFKDSLTPEEIEAIADYIVTVVSPIGGE